MGSRGAVVCAALSERKVAGSIPTIGDFHTVGPCKKAVFACLVTDVNKIPLPTFTNFFVRVVVDHGCDDPLGRGGGGAMRRASPVGGRKAVLSDRDYWMILRRLPRNSWRRLLLTATLTDW